MVSFFRAFGAILHFAMARLTPRSVLTIQSRRSPHLLSLVFIFYCCCCYCSFYSSGIGFATGAAAASSAPGGTSAISPIQNFGPSVAASNAQGTIVAVAYPLGAGTRKAEGDLGVSNDGAGIVVLSLSSSSTKSTDDIIVPLQPSHLKHPEAINVNGIHILPNRDLLRQVLRKELKHPRWASMGSEALCCFTGFSADADYLIRALQENVDSQQTLHEGDSSHVTARQIVNWLSEELREAGESEGSRPYGVQALLVGLSSQKELSMYTFDPSGGYRHWCAATVIGRGSIEKRKLLADLLQKGPVLDGAQALSIAARCLVGEEPGQTIPQIQKNVDGVLIKMQDDGRMRAYQIDGKDIIDCYEDITKPIH